MHRIGHGRRGPVFSTHQAQELTALAGPDEHLAAAIVDVDRRRDRGAPLAAESTASSPPAPEAAHATAPAPGTAEEATAPPTPAETPPPLARRIPRRASLPTPSVPTTSSHEVEVDLGGDTVT
ncbi:MAG: hypothetical protein KDA97_14690, partial [Acidimicrobiales bacterium]|nr:hypothetical protein [Acidimicrobiales bacterium]